jgi:arginase
VAVTSRQVTLIGAASSAGTHHAGQDQAPTALRAAGLPERLRRLPETARGHGEDMRRLAGDLRTPGRRLLSVPLALWRLREVTELVRPHAAVLPFLSVWFLTLSAIAAFAAVAEIVIALVLLIAAVV